MERLIRLEEYVNAIYPKSSAHNSDRSEKTALDAVLNWIDREWVDIDQMANDYRLQKKFDDAEKKELEIVLTNQTK